MTKQDLKLILKPRLDALGVYRCLACEGPAKYRPPAYRGLFCANACQQEYVFARVTMPRFAAGLIVNRKTLRRCLTRRDGEACAMCGNVEWLGRPIPLEVDHVNGNPADRRAANLRLLCPNCHAMTPSFAGRNKGYGRSSLGLATWN